jgi:uncharacterized membrane protein HdeD (DUF308 family)
MYDIKVLRKPVNHWYLYVILGLVLIGVGIYTFTTPSESLLTLAIVFTIAFIITGVSEIIYALSNSKTLHSWGWSLADGIITLLIGILMATNTAMSIDILLLYIGFTILMRSAHAISTGASLRSYGTGGNKVVFAGVLGMLFAFMLIWNPAMAGITVVIWIGLAFIMAGLAAVVLGLHLKNLHQKFDRVSSDKKDLYDHASSEMHKALK